MTTATRNYVLPAFKQAFEKSQTYADLAAPTLAEIAPQLDTAAKRAAMDNAVLAKKLCVLSSRIATALKRVAPDAVEMAPIAALPEELRTAEGAMLAAIEADDSNATLKVWLATLQGKSDEEVAAAAKAAYIADPTDSNLFTIVFTHEITSADIEGKPLEHTVVIANESKTVAEWLSHAVTLDEFNGHTLRFVAQLLSAVRKMVERMISAVLEEDITARYMPLAQDDEQRCQIEVHLATMMQKAMRIHRPTISIDGQEFNASMLAARVVQVREMHITAFGEDAVSATHFATKPVPAKPARAHLEEAYKRLASEIASDECVVVDVYEKSLSGMTSTGTKTVDELSAIVEALALDPSHDCFWEPLTRALMSQRKTSATIGGTRFTTVQCAANACEHAPTEQRSWQLLMTVFLAAAQATVEGDPVDDAQIEAALSAVPVAIRGVTLPVAVMAYLMVKPPTTEQEFGQLLAQLQQEPEM